MLSRNHRVARGASDYPRMVKILFVDFLHTSTPSQVRRRHFICNFLIR